MTKTKDIQGLIERVDNMFPRLKELRSYFPEEKEYQLLLDCKTALQESIEQEKNYCDLMNMYNELLNSDEKKCYNELEQLKYEYKKVMDRVEDTEDILEVLDPFGLSSTYGVFIIQAIQQYIRGKDDE